MRREVSGPVDEAEMASRSLDFIVQDSLVTHPLAAIDGPEEQKELVLSIRRVDLNSEVTGIICPG